MKKKKKKMGWRTTHRNCKKWGGKRDILQKFGRSCCQSTDINSFTCLVVKSTMGLKSSLKRFNFNECKSKKELSKVLWFRACDLSQQSHQQLLHFLYSQIRKTNPCYFKTLINQLQNQGDSGKSDHETPTSASCCRCDDFTSEGVVFSLQKLPHIFLSLRSN